MEQFDTVLYFSAAALQLAAMFYAVLMAREVNDRRPWLALFIALFIMFVMRIVAIYVPVSVRAHFGPSMKAKAAIDRGWSSART
jgi:hypothetical protein